MTTLLFVLTFQPKSASLSASNYSFLRSSLEVRTSSWSGPSGRASARSRRGWGGCGSRNNRTWSWLSLWAGPTCPAPDQTWTPTTASGPLSSAVRSSYPQAHDSSTDTGPTWLAAPVTNLCKRPVILQPWLDSCQMTPRLATRLRFTAPKTTWQL